MPRRPTARRYAQAAFEIALEHDALDQWTKELEEIEEALRDEDFATLLGAPQVPQSVKLQGVDTVLQDKSKLARNFVSVLVEHGQSHLLPEIRDRFRQFVDAHEGVARANVVTAVPLDAQQRQRVEQLLGDITRSAVVTTTRVDPDIVGGVVARIGDLLIDGSVRHRLERMKADLAHPPERQAMAAGGDSQSGKAESN